ncbi:FAD-dependent oxidoreductase [Legionella waltersii]|uniref:2-polyprenyl-6-methoxyphenol hydroxylase n=1 Tax=Legionella waltersii TaxID=66969 RepID=A0A0W1A5J2_9GAMM|nr:FAD-dependent oxidoreductase [Legionella waltersii]KTD76537.1 2-polyprenyl-6-methoxyphenol hydroxylase [Legionella waltersii]SNU94004.1 2-polyprenyl-6-methoxyphenol hydroxylase [Legionella waltersii]
MSPTYDVLVIGGGVVGLSAALAMAKRQLHVAVIDAGPIYKESDSIDLRVYAINRASQALFTELEVWEEISANRTAPYQKMHVWDASTGAHIDFDSRTIAESRLGTIVEESCIKKALMSKISAISNIKLFPQHKIDKVMTLDHSIEVANGTTVWAGKLLMICDGANSTTRNLLNVPLTTWSYQQNALIAMVKTELPHERTAYQVFNADGPLAFLPLEEAHHCSIVWSTTPERIAHLMALSSDEFNQELAIAFNHRLGRVELESERHQFPLHMRHVKQYVGTRWMLLGDAAHTIHPLAGLGLNIGLADVKAWMNCLERNTGALVSNKVLRAYQRERKHAVWQSILLMDAFKRLFSNTSSPLSNLRKLGLNFCNEFTPIKRLFIQHAAGN